MQKTLGTAIVVLIISVLVVGVASGSQGQPASKATAKVGAINVLNQTSLGPTVILSNVIKTPNQKDLFVDVSLECGLYTQTEVKSKGGVKDTSTAEAGVVVWVEVDGQRAYPGDVTFCRRSQQLSATLGGILENCTDSNNDGDIDLSECTLADEEIELILDTMNANSFNFILDDLSAGEHTVAVYASIGSSTSAQNGSADASATIGNGSVTVEEVRLIQNEDILLD